MNPDCFHKSSLVGTVQLPALILDEGSTISFTKTLLRQPPPSSHLRSLPSSQPALRIPAKAAAAHSKNTEGHSRSLVISGALAVSNMTLQSPRYQRWCRAPALPPLKRWKPGPASIRPTFFKCQPSLVFQSLTVRTKQLWLRRNRGYVGGRTRPLWVIFRNSPWPL